MVIRRFLFSWVCLLASSLFMYGQVAVKTNVAIDAVAIPNLGVEVGLSKKLTVDIPFYYNPWKYSDNKMLKLVMVQPELRYWLCDLDPLSKKVFTTILIRNMYLRQRI